MRPYRFSVYVTQSCLSSLCGRRDRDILRVLKQYEIEKVYLESFRTKLLPEEELRHWKRFFEENGFLVSGGVGIGLGAEGYAERGIDVNGEPETLACFTSPVTLGGFKRIIETTARVFDEIIIDDFFSHWCRCDRCRTLFNERFGHDFTQDGLRRLLASPHSPAQANWEEFSRQVVVDAARDWVLAPGKQANPNVKIIVKVAEWYDQFRFKGQRLPELAELFDGIWVGTESREGTERYGPFFIYQWVQKRASVEKAKGTWIDSLSGRDYSVSIDPMIYVESARMSVLNGSDELVLFNYSLLSRDPECPQRLFLEMGALRQIANEISGAQPIGLGVIKEDDPQGLNTADRYIYDFVGTTGVPVRPIVRDEAQTCAALLVSANELSPENGALYRGLAEGGSTLFFTSEAIRIVTDGIWGEQGPNLLGLSPRAPDANRLLFNISAFVDGDSAGHFHPVDHRRYGVAPVGPAVSLDRATMLLGGYDGERVLPVIFENRVGKGRVVGLCLTACPAYLHELTYGTGRWRELAGDAVGITLASPYSRIIVLPYSNGVVALDNLNDTPCRVTLRLDTQKLLGIPAASAHISDLLRCRAVETQLDGQVVVYESVLPPRSLTCLRICRIWERRGLGNI